MRHYRTGDDELDRRIAALVDAAGIHRDNDLVFEMVVSALRMGREAVDRGELKLVNAALKELRYSFYVFEPYAAIPKVSIFGSARTRTDDPSYLMARDFARAMAAEEWMVITGAGPGIMEAGIEGAGVDQAFGVNIVLPFESAASPSIARDPKLINFRYFFTRKITFMKESKAFALLPGGFGTMDEAFELLTLMQTGRSPVAPVVLMEPEGGTYWPSWLHFIEHELLARGLIAADDLRFVRLTTSVTEAVEEIVGFYTTYHSQRYVGRRLVLRLKHAIDDALLAEINDEFSDILTSGSIEPVPASPSEIEDGDVPDLPRLAFHFDRASYARLRLLIDRINGRSASPSIPDAS
ncbi:MAG: LOG family protein [Acidimicrobiales bacterium]|nr:LOG family protein [Acidimicrobiales bacterium]